MRPLVLVDVDGVLANFNQLVIDAVHAFSGKRHTEEDVIRYDILSCMDVPQHLKEAVWRHVQSPGSCQSISPYPGAKEGLDSLREVADVHVVTTPLVGSHSWQSERTEWLRTHFNIHHEDVTFTHKKDLVRGDFIVDDKPEHVDRPGGMLWDQPYNRHALCFRFTRWESVISWVTR